MAKVFALIDITRYLAYKTTLAGWAAELSMSRCQTETLGIFLGLFI